MLETKDKDAGHRDKVLPPAATTSKIEAFLDCSGGFQALWRVLIGSHGKNGKNFMLSELLDQMLIP